MKQLGRFLRLERERKDTGPATPLPSRRFETLERAQDAGRAGSPVSRATGGLERFAPEPEAALVLEPPDSTQPFVRCVRCGADSARHATVCVQCEARLDTEQGRAFNARLWAETTATRQKEEEMLRRRQQAREAGDVEAVSPAELAARAEAQLELERLSRASTPSWLRPQGLGVGAGPLLLVSAALAVPGLVFAISHRGRVGLAVLLLGIVSLLLAAWRRAP